MAFFAPLRFLGKFLFCAVGNGTAGTPKSKIKNLQVIKAIQLLVGRRQAVQRLHRGRLPSSSASLCGHIRCSGFICTDTRRPPLSVSIFFGRCLGSSAHYDLSLRSNIPASDPECLLQANIGLGFSEQTHSSAIPLTAAEVKPTGFRRQIIAK